MHGSIHGFRPRYQTHLMLRAIERESPAVLSIGLNSRPQKQVTASSIVPTGFVYLTVPPWLWIKLPGGGFRTVDPFSLMIDAFGASENQACLRPFATLSKVLEHEPKRPCAPSLQTPTETLPCSLLAVSFHHERWECNLYHNY